MRTESVRTIAPFWGGKHCGVDVPLNAANCGKIECINVWFVFKYLIADWMNSYEQRTLIGRAELTKPKQIKWIMTCVSLNGLSEFNTQYFFMGMVRFESQEYTLQGRMHFFAKLDKIRLF